MAWTLIADTVTRRDDDMKDQMEDFHLLFRPRPAAMVVAAILCNLNPAKVIQAGFHAENDK